MREELSIFVNENYPPAKQELFYKAFEVFDDYDLDQYDLGFIDIISVYDNSDPIEIQLKLESHLMELLKSILIEQSIILNEDVDLNQIIEITAALKLIEDYEDKDSIIRYLESDYTDEEKLCNILSLVSNLTLDDYLLMIDSFDTNILNLIELTAIGYDSSSTEPQEQTDESNLILNNVKLFKNFTNDNELIGFKILRKGFKVGIEFQWYGRYLKKYLLDYTNIEKAALEFFLLLLMGKESYNNPINYFRKISLDYIDSLNEITKLDLALTNVFNNFEKYKSKTITDNKRYYSSINSHEIPVGKYKGIVSGYSGIFEYNNKKYEVTNRDMGIRGTVPAIIEKLSNGLFLVEM